MGNHKKYIVVDLILLTAALISITYSIIDYFYYDGHLDANVYHIEQNFFELGYCLIGITVLLVEFPQKFLLMSVYHIHYGLYLLAGLFFFIYVPQTALSVSEIVFVGLIFVRTFAFVLIYLQLHRVRAQTRV